MEGKGIETWADGRRYEGEFKNGKKDGEGTFEWANGQKYIGSWKNGKQHGIGIIYTPQNGEKRQGEWANGHRLRWVRGVEMLASPTQAKR